jgi:hypothetical protein
MAKNPAFPFYANDYLVDTLRWSRGMKSLHVDLMCESWANGKLKDDSGYPEGLNSEDKKLWTKIAHKWILIDGIWINEKLEKCRSAREAFLKNQSDKGKKSAAVKKYTQPKINHGSTTVQPLEDEKEKENFLLKLKEQEKKIEAVETTVELLQPEILEVYDELTRETLIMTYRDVDVDDQWLKFQSKVRGSPGHYANHGLEGLRLAFNKHLQTAPKKNGTSKTGQRSDAVNARREAFARKHGTGTGG